MVTELSYLGLLKISGHEAEKFLQGQLTCDVKMISPTQTSLGAHCTPQGRIISLFRLFYWQDSYFLQMPTTLLPIAKKALEKYAIFFKTQLSIADSIKQYGYDDSSLKNIHPLPNKVNEAVINENRIAIQIPGQQKRYILISDSEITPGSNYEEQWKCEDIQAGIPTIYPETSEQFLPHEINLPELGAVSFQKGCYTGQEIIARMEYRGKLKNHLFQAELHSEQLPQRGADLFCDKAPCGKIVDFCCAGHHHYNLLIMISENDSRKSISLTPDNQAPLQIKI